MNYKEAQKQGEELRIFKDFAGNHLQAEGIILASSRNCAPPFPDIECFLEETRYFFELGEIADRGLAAGVSRLLRTGATTGGAFSQEAPLLYIIRSKAQKTYTTDGCGLDLLLHYSKQYPYEPLVLESFKIHDQELSRLFLEPLFPFQRIWIYNDWNKELILKIVCKPSEILAV